MVNIKRKEFFDVITGNSESGRYYGIFAAIFKNVDNIDMVYDSRGQYLGLRTCRGMFKKDGKYTGKEGPRDFKSVDDLKVWAGMECSHCDGHISVIIENDNEEN